MRLDQALVARGLVTSRTQAQKLIEAGCVTVGGLVISKSATALHGQESIEVQNKARFVSRGGDKLDFALSCWPIEVGGRDCLDVGASTGGFTDCLLQRGAARVFCVDCGSNQLHPSLRDEARVTFREQFNARYLQRTDLPFEPQLVVMDVSFISQTLLLPALFEIMPARAELVSLVKPQFELSPAELGKGGIVRENAKHAKALQRVKEAAQNLQFEVLDTLDSPIEGGDGNREFLLWLRK